MKDLVARCKIRKPSYVNNGYIYIKKDIIEGLFTNDFVKISIDNNKLILHLTEDIYFEDSNGILRHKEVVSLFWMKYRYNTIYIPEEYHLKNENKELILYTECLINDQNLIDSLLKKIATK